VGIFGKGKTGTVPAAPAMPVSLDEAKRVLRINETQHISDESIWKMTLADCSLSQEQDGYWIGALVNEGGSVGFNVAGQRVGTLHQRNLRSAVDVFTRYGKAPVPCVVTWTTRNWNAYVPMG